MELSHMAVFHVEPGLVVGCDEEPGIMVLSRVEEEEVFEDVSV